MWRKWKDKVVVEKVERRGISLSDGVVAFLVRSYRC